MAAGSHHAPGTNDSAKLRPYLLEPVLLLLGIRVPVHLSSDNQGQVQGPERARQQLLLSLFTHRQVKAMTTQSPCSAIPVQS